MKKLITKLMALVALLLFGMSLNAADVELRYANSFSSQASYTFSTTDVLNASDPVTFSTSTSNTVFPAPNNFRVQAKQIILELKSTSASVIKLYGESSGSTSTRTIYQVSVADAIDGTYTLVDDVSNSGTNITSTIVGQTTAACTSTVTGLSIPVGKFVKINFCTSSSGGSLQNINISGFDITPVPIATPTITEFIVAGITASIDQDAKTITAELPYGTSLTALTPTVTTGGTSTGYSPTGAQDFSSAVNYVVTDGNSANDVTYAVTLTVSAVASSNNSISDVTIGGIIPTFDAGTNTFTVVLPKASDLSSQIVAFTKDVTATSSITSGAAANLATTFDFIVTAQNSDVATYHINAIVGTKNIAYVTAASGNDDPYLHGSLLSKGYYVEDVIAVDQATSYYDSFDLAILFDVVSSSNTAAVNMAGLIGTKRFLNLKAYMYGKTGWPTGGGANFTDPDAVQKATVMTNYVSHPIFSGLTFADADLTLVDAGGTYRALQGVTTPGSGTVIATVANNPTAANIIEDNSVESAMYMFIGLANGGSTYGLANISADGKKLLDNAVEYLLGDTKYVPNSTSLKGLEISGVTFDGTTIHNAQNVLLNVYDIAGRLIVSSTNDIQMSGISKGTYIVRSNNGVLKIALIK